MIYIDNDRLPLQYRNDGGLNLCKLWFLTKNGYNMESLEALGSLDMDKVRMTQIRAYKIAPNEILKIGDSWFVGDGMGNIAYAPCRDNVDKVCYEAGTLRISEKYEVQIEG